MNIAMRAILVKMVRSLVNDASVNRVGRHYRTYSCEDLVGVLNAKGFSGVTLNDVEALFQRGRQAVEKHGA